MIMDATHVVKGYSSYNAVSSFFFFIGFNMLLIKTLTDFSLLFVLPEVAAQALIALGAASFVFGLFFQHDEPLRKMIKVLLLAVAALSWYKTGGQTVMLISMLAIMGSVDISIQSILKNWLIVTAAFIAIHVLAYLVTYISDPSSLYVWHRRPGDAGRHGLYFTNPNIIGAFLCFIGCVSLYLWKRKIVYVLCGFGLTVFIYLTTRSFTPTLALAGFSLLLYAEDRWGLLRKRFVLRFIQILPLLMIVFVLLMSTVLYGSKVFDIFNNALTSRPYLWHSNYVNAGFTLLGQPAISTLYLDNGLMEKSLTIDSFYGAGLFTLGIGMLAVFVVGYITACKKRFELHDYRSLACFAVIAFYGLTEYHVANFFICILLIFFSSCFMKVPPSEAHSCVLQSRSAHVA